MGGHSQIGARRLLHLLVVHHEELLLEITSEMRRVTSGSLDGVFFIATPLAIGVPGFTFTALDTGLSIDSDAIVANQEELSPKAWWERWAGAGRDLGVWLGAFLQDCMERVIQKLSDLHHVYRWRRLVSLR